MAGGEFRSKERDPIADLACLIARRDASRGSAAIDNRCFQKSASEAGNERPALSDRLQVPVDLNAFEQALKQAYQLRECSHEETGELNDPGDEQYGSNVSRGRTRGPALVMAIIALALVGTAGAFGYRILFGGIVSPTLTPSIKAINQRSTIASVNELQAASSSDARRAAPAITGSIDNVVAQEGQPAAVASSKTDPQALLALENGHATPTADQSVPPQGVKGVVVAPDPPGPPPTSPVLGSGYAV